MVLLSLLDTHISKKMARKKLLLMLTSILAIIGLIFVVSIVLVHADGPVYVSTTGTDTGDCTNPTQPCQSIQYALGQIASGEIWIAAGTYNLTQRITISKSNITLRGGYPTDNTWLGSPNLETDLTILDGGRKRHSYLYPICYKCSC